MTVISDSKSLEELCDKIVNADKFVAVDTEFLRDKTYYAKLCLIQLGTSFGEFAVDCLNIDDFSPLKKLFLNKKLLKIFHSCRQDLEIIHHVLKMIPEPVFDTQIAAALCGLNGSASYAYLVKHFLGKNVDKTHRFTNWAARPLSDKQLTYALLDVHYLRDIYVNLVEMLAHKSRTQWMEQECQGLKDTSIFLNKADRAWEKFDLDRKPAEYIHFVKALAYWREEKAAERDVPKGHLFDDKMLEDLVEERPETKEQLAKFRGYSKMKFKDSFLEELLEQLKAIQQNMPEFHIKKSNNKLDEKLLALLKILLSVKSASFKIAEQLITTNNDLELFANNSEADVSFLHGWRHEVYGQDALNLKNGQIGIGVKNNQIQVINLIAIS